MRWVSGLNQQFAKLSYGLPYRGFESPFHRNSRKANRLMPIGFSAVARAPKHTSSYIYNHVVIIKDTHRPFKKTSPQIPNYFIIFLFSPTEAIPQKQNNKDKNNCPQKKVVYFLHNIDCVKINKRYQININPILSLNSVLPYSKSQR